jgi:hypothetical protein
VPEQVLDREAEQVRAWIIEHLRALGFNQPQRSRLLEADVSWHEAQDLLEAGCPIHLVFRILR